jgi:hypothetical protein
MTFLYRRFRQVANGFDRRLKVMQRIFPLAAILVLVLTTQMLTQNKPSNDDDNNNGAPQVQELLAKAADALGGAERLRAVNSLSLSGTLRRVFPDQTRSGTYEISFLSPDKYKKVERAEVSTGTQLNLTQMLNKDGGWSGTGIKTGGLELNLDQLGAHARPLSTGARRQMRAEFAVHLLAKFLAAPAPSSVQFSYAGRAGASHADAFMLDMRGADDLAARVFLDPKTYLPLAMSYRGRPPMITVDPQAAERGAQSFDTELEVRFSESGLVLPHHIRVESGGKLLEEFEMKTCRINPPEVVASDFKRN